MRRYHGNKIVAYAEDEGEKAIILPIDEALWW